MKRTPLVQLVAAKLPELTAEHAYALILCGEILVNGERVRDPRRSFPDGSLIERVEPGFVSRGGRKLQAALDEWQIDVHGKVFVDAGASTGGFTDCLLQRGARHVHAVEAGTNQLAYPLRVDSRVSVHEGTNILDVSLLDPPADAAVADLSLRSLRGVCAHLLELAAEKWAVVLMKPQYERHGLGATDRRSVGVNEELRRLLALLVDALRDEGVHVTRIMESPIRGRRGNREFLALIRDREEVSRAALFAALPVGY